MRARVFFVFLCVYRLVRPLRFEQVVVHRRFLYVCAKEYTHISGISGISPKHQVTIPKEAMQRFGFNTGDRLLFTKP